MHRLLKRQIDRHLGKEFEHSPLFSEISNFLESVSTTYDELYNEKKFLEHTIDVNSQDLEKANKKILQQNTHLQKLLDKSSDENEEMVHLLKQYKHAIDTSLIVSITDLSGKITYVNDNFCKISGYSQSELIGKSHSIVRHPDNKKALFKDMWGTILNKKVWQGVFPNLAKDGSTYYVSATIVPLLNIYGEIIEFMALREDVTQTILSQNQIKAEKHRVSEILDNQESIIVLFNRREGVVEANKKFFEVFGFLSLGEFKLQHRCVCDLFEERENFLKPSTNDRFWIDPVLEDRGKVHMALIKGKVYGVRVAIIHMNEEETFLATFTDITEIEEARVKSQEAEKEKANFLANMSHEIRTPMNAILGFSELLAKTQLDTRQNKFVELIRNSSTTLIHIINDILDFSKLESGQTDIDLVKINPFMEFEETFMLLSQKAKEKYLSYMINIDPLLEECIEIDSFHVKQILMNLIGNAIKFTPEHGTIDIRIKKYIQENQKMIRFSVQDTGIGIPKDRQDKIFEPFSQADSSTTRQFGGTGLGLSISNSLVAMMGSKLCLESEEGIGSKFYFDVKYESCLTKNTLQGHLSNWNIYLCELDSKILTNLANQLNAYNIKYKTIRGYEQSADLESSIIISTNLEVTQSFKYAKVLLIGKIEQGYEDNRHQNIEMFEEFPSVIYNELMRLRLIKTDIACSNENQNIHLKILVAEDYEINRILISELLDQFDIEYEFALNGQEAVDMVKDNEYDLILMDINMPIMNGMDAAKIMIEQLQITTPIVALTANALEGDKERFLSIGMVDYLSKPIDIKAFESLLIKYHQKNQVQSSVGKKMTDKPCLDVQASLQAASKKMNFPEHIIKKLFSSYVTSLEEIEKNIQEAMATNTYETIQMNAHNLKSGAASLCFDEIASIAQTLESNAKEKNESFEYKTEFEKIQEYLQLLKKWNEKLSS